MQKKSMIMAGSLAAVAAAIAGGLALAAPALADTTSGVSGTTSVVGVEDGTNDGETADD